MSEYLYGIQNGKPVSIADIPVEMKGLKCDCICPDCGRAFEACSLQGKVSRYFRHYSDKHAESEGSGGGAGPGCDVDWANESGLHKMAKHIIAHERRVAVPEIEIPLGKLKLGLPDNIKKRLPPAFVFSKATVLECLEVVLEPYIADFKPDALVKTPREYIIEIFASHRVDEDKAQKASNHGVPMLEINLSSFMENPISYDDLRKLITESTELREWVFNPDFDVALDRAREYYMSFPEVQEFLKKRAEREREEAQRKAEEDRRKQAEAVKRERRTEKLRVLLQPNNYASALRNLRNDNAFFQKVLHQTPDDFSFYRQHKEVPFFIDIPIAGEMIFQCDRRIWQGIIFNRYVYRRNPGKDGISIDDVFNALVNQHKIPVDWDLSYKISIPQESPSVKEYFFRHEVVRTYFEYLEKLGFIYIDRRKIGGEWKTWGTVRAMRTLTPPDQETAERLQVALKKVDVFSPEVDYLIRNELRDFLLARNEAIRKAEEQKRLVAENAKKAEALARREAAEAREKEKRELHEQAIKDFDFSNPDKIISDFEGWRLAQCTSCGAVIRACRIFKYSEGNMNQGICRSCAVQIRKTGTNPPVRR